MKPLYIISLLFFKSSFGAINFGGTIMNGEMQNSIPSFFEVVCGRVYIKYIIVTRLIFYLSD